MWVGVDDTDGPGSGCTTWVLTELLRGARVLELDPIGLPRLVRLNPNVPFKTRGNAALSVRLGHGRGERRRAGSIDGAPVFAYAHGRPPTDRERDRFADAAWATVLASAPMLPGTDPALVVSRSRPPEAVYWKAVRELVPLEEVREELDRLGADCRVREEPRGLVGAAASIAWRGRRRTWELITYRTPERLGTQRRVSARSVREAEAAEPNLFLCEDPKTRRLLVAPHTGCPVLFGLRSLDPDAAVRALPRVRSERWDRWVLFQTNQGTGDHLLRRLAGELGGFRSGIVAGTVAAMPTVRTGGHVAFTLIDRTGTALECVAFEPTKTLPRVAQQFRPGDELTVWGSSAQDPTLRLEGFRVRRTTRNLVREPPGCPSCGRRTASLGRGRGWRCPGCRGRLPPEAARWRPRARGLDPGVYHPTRSARRHLAPLGP